MKIYGQENWEDFMGMVPSMKKNLEEWRIVQVFLREHENQGVNSIRDIAERLRDSLHASDGALFIFNDWEILAFVRVKPAFQTEDLKRTVAESLKGFSCQVRATAAGLAGLQKLEMILTQDPATRDSMRKIMVVDDDMFLRSIIVSAVKSYGTVVEIDRSEGMMERYMKEKPDVVFLDIHLPGGSGIDLLRDIRHRDPDVCVIMVSADSARENVLEAKKIGANWFLTKPVTKSKIVEAMQKCPRFHRI